MRDIFILVPVLNDSGVIKGAVAIANGLANFFNVSIVIIKRIELHSLAIDPAVQIISLGKKSFWLAKYRAYQRLLIGKKGKQPPVSISMCYSADLINLFVKKYAFIISSVRTNLSPTYFHTYGWPGYLLAQNHFFLLKYFHFIISISKSMTEQLNGLGFKQVRTIENFIDEENMKKKLIKILKPANRIPKIFFSGSLITRKRPDLIVDAVYKLKNEGLIVNVFFLGDGPLMNNLKKKVTELDLCDHITFCGHLSDPYSKIQEMDYLVLPSEAEGVPRAAMESLFFGIPCILRRIDGNVELIHEGKNGFLFSSDEEFIEILRKIAVTHLRSKEGTENNLIPNNFRYDSNIKKFVDLINRDLT